MRSEKTEVARSKRRHRKGGGQAATKKRSPLRRMWNRGRARSAKVHACGAQLNREFQEISRECEGGLKIKDARAGALEAPYGCWRTALFPLFFFFPFFFLFFFRDDASKKSENGKSLENLKIENTRLLR